MMDTEAITLEEFLANDYESYEYSKGELVPMSFPTMEHGMAIFSLRLKRITSIRFSGK